MFFRIHTQRSSLTDSEINGPHYSIYMGGVGELGTSFPVSPRSPAGAGYPGFPRGGGRSRPRPAQCASQRAGPQFLHLPLGGGVPATSGRKAKHYLLLASSAPPSFPLWCPRKRWRIGLLLSPYHIIIRLTHQFCLVTHLLAALHCSSRTNPFCPSNLVPL